MATTRPTPPEQTDAQIAADQAVELERLRAENAELRAGTPAAETAIPKRYAKAEGPAFAVLWAKVSLVDLPDGADGPRFVVPDGRKPVNGFTTVTRGELIAGANPEGAAHVAELLTLGAVRPAA